MELKKFVINGVELKYRNSDENVLIPRPETELLCEYAIDIIKQKT